MQYTEEMIKQMKKNWATELGTMKEESEWWFEDSRKKYNLYKFISTTNGVSGGFVALVCCWCCRWRIFFWPF